MRYTLHNESGDYLEVSSRSLHVVKDKCNQVGYNCKVYEEYLAPSPWDSSKMTKHGREVYRNF